MLADKLELAIEAALRNQLLDVVHGCHLQVHSSRRPKWSIGMATARKMVELHSEVV